MPLALLLTCVSGAPRSHTGEPNVAKHGNESSAPWELWDTFHGSCGVTGGLSTLQQRACVITAFATLGLIKCMLGMCLGVPPEEP